MDSVGQGRLTILFLVFFFKINFPSLVSMDANSASGSSLPWLWVIEFLSSFKQVDTSILNDLIVRTPDFSDPLGKSARERVTLRCLEDVFGPINSRSVSSGVTSKIKFNLSECCEVVFQHIINELPASSLRMAGPELLKWDVNPFLAHKKSSLPKCALEQLKDAIVEGSHPFVASLKERSGLLSGNQCDVGTSRGDGDPNAVACKLNETGTYGQIAVEKRSMIPPIPENGIEVLPEDSPDGNLSNRDRSDVVPETGKELSPKDFPCGNLLPFKRDRDNAVGENAKKLRQHLSCNTFHLGQNLGPSHGKELLEDPSGRIERCTGREGRDLEKEFQRGCAGFSVEDHNDHIASGRLSRSSDVNGNDNQKNLLPLVHLDDKMPQDISVDEAQDDNDSGAQLRRSDGTHLNRTLQAISISLGESEHDIEHNTLDDAPSGGSHMKKFSDEALEDIEHWLEQEKLSDNDEYHDVTVKKRHFLSSHCTFSYELLEKDDLTQLNLCLKCNKGGQVLLCSASTCPLAVHESCLGSAANFDNLGNFFCPFCTYSCAISDYLEAKKKVSLARKELNTFVGSDVKHQQKKPSQRFCQKKQNKKRKHGCMKENIIVNNHNHVNTVTDTQCRSVEDLQAEPLLPCVNDNGSCRKEEPSQTLRVASEEKGGENIMQEPESARAGSMCDVDTQRPAEVGQEVPRQTTNSFSDFGGPIILDAEGSSDRQNNQSNSRYFVRFRRQERTYTSPAIPQLRRMNLPWTEEEEEMLKEGVQIFSVPNNRGIPWKKILEYGVTVFQKGRTTIDLKDKWRNICKGSPKPN